MPRSGQNFASGLRLLCDLLRPLIKILFLLFPYGDIIFKMKRIPKEMTVLASSCKTIKHDIRPQGLQVSNVRPASVDNRLSPQTPKASCMIHGYYCMEIACV